MPFIKLPYVVINTDDIENLSPNALVIVCHVLAMPSEFTTDELKSRIPSAESICTDEAIKEALKSKTLSHIVRVEDEK